MKFSEICKMPSVRNNVHESVYRSYQILERVKEYLAKGYSAEMILEMIETMETVYEPEERNC